MQENRCHVVDESGGIKSTKLEEPADGIDCEFHECLVGTCEKRKILSLKIQALHGRRSQLFMHKHDDPRIKFAWRVEQRFQHGPQDGIEFKIACQTQLTDRYHHRESIFNLQPSEIAQSINIRNIKCLDDN